MDQERGEPPWGNSGLIGRDYGQPMSDAYFPCSMNVRLDALPPREAVLVEGSWRVAHAFNSSLPGWLVVVPLRHVSALEDMTEEEAQTLGLVLHRCSRALREVTGCVKSYLMFFAEAEGFSHLHVHVVPRMASFTEEQVGPRVFTFLGSPEADWLSEADRDDVALRLRAALGVGAP